MTSLEVALAWTNAALMVLGGLLLRSYLPAYVKAKATNLATKEDISEITEKVESVRAAIARDSVLLEKRREVYERISDALRVFISGHEATAQQKEAFHSAYAACWLWAPDSLLLKLNTFLTMQKAITANLQAHSQEELKATFGEIIILMRKDAGFDQTTLNGKGYEFVRF